MQKADPYRVAFSTLLIHIIEKAGKRGLYAQAYFGHAWVSRCSAESSTRKSYVAGQMPPREEDFSQTHASSSPSHPPVWARSALLSGDTWELPMRLGVFGSSHDYCLLGSSFSECEDRVIILYQSVSVCSSVSFYLVRVTPVSEQTGPTRVA